MILFENVSKKFGATIALDDITLEVKQGEFVFIVGPSGAGKSSLLKILTREILPSDGKIKLGNVDITKIKTSEIPQFRRKIGMVFQDFKLLDDRTVFEKRPRCGDPSFRIIGRPSSSLLDCPACKKGQQL